MRVNAMQAATLAGVRERTVRGWIHSGKLRAERSSTPGGAVSWAIAPLDLAALGVRLDPQRLHELASRHPRDRETTAARIAHLERRLEELERRLRDLELERSAGAKTIAPSAARPTRAYRAMLTPPDEV